MLCQKTEWTLIRIHICYMYLEGILPVAATVTEVLSGIEFPPIVGAIWRTNEGLLASTKGKLRLTGANGSGSIASTVGMTNRLAGSNVHTPPVVLPDLDRVEVALGRAAWREPAQRRLAFTVGRSVSVSVAFQQLSHEVAGFGGGHAVLAGGGASTAAADLVSRALLVGLALEVAGVTVFRECHDE